MRGRGAAALVPALVVLSLVGIVAIAATGSTPGGSGEARRPSDTILDTVLTLGVLLLIPGAALLVYGLMQRKAIAQEVASGRYRRTSILAFLLLVGLYTAAGYFGLLRRIAPQAPPEETVILPGGELPPPTVGVDETGAYEAQFALVPALVVLTLLVLIAVAAYLALQRRPVRGDEAAGSVSAAIADLLSDTLDDLRREADPRRAVIAAYARFELVLDSRGLPRRPVETPEEYLARILGSLDVGERAVRRLTELFEEAKFSNHAVPPAMKEDAIDALVEVRDQLLARPRGAAPTPTVSTAGSA